MATIFCKVGATGSDDGTSWEDAFPSLQDAIDDSSASGDQVWVAEGTYTVTATLTMDNANAPDLYGGFSNTLTGTNGSVAGRDLDTDITVLDGDASYKIMTVTQSCVIDGIKFYNGAYASGAGMQINSASIDVDLDNCVFDTNVGTYQGGAIIVSAASSLDISNCEFTSNSGAQYGGAIHNVSTDLTITDTLFDGNSCAYTGAVMYMLDGALECTDCVFVDQLVTAGLYSGGGAFYLYSITSADFLRCKFTDNTGGSNSRGGAIRTDTTDTTFTNCVFSGNAATYGGAIYFSGTQSSRITNCTIADNSCSTSNGGGGIRIYSGPTVDIVNTQLWGNEANSTAHQILNTGTLTVTYSNVEGSWTGTGNQNDDPEFKGTGDDPYDLNTTSDSVDAGNAGATDYPSTDFLERARVDDPATTNTGTGTPAYSDIGAYEYQVAVSAKKVSLLWAFN